MTGPSDDVERAAERLVRLGQRNLTWPELCRRAGVEHDVADRLWRALGFPDVDPEDPVYSEEDVRALKIATEGLARLDGAQRREAVEFLVREARSVSAFLSRITEIQVDALADLASFGLRQEAIEQANERGIADSDLGWLIFYALRRRLDEVLRRRATSEPGNQPILCVGFVDLVDFTRTSARLDPNEFGGFLNRFEALVWDTVTEAGGRVVKLIGDEAMLVCPSAGEAGRAALDVLRLCQEGELPLARAGLAAGRLLMQGGDYFGPAVNLASRLVDRAEPNTVLVDAQFRQRLDGGDGFELRDRGDERLKGIGGVPVWSLADSSSNLDGAH
jgi:adenylate cyclase